MPFIKPTRKEVITVHAPSPRGILRRNIMVRFGNNVFQSVASVVLYGTVLAAIGYSVVTAISPILA